MLRATAPQMVATGGPGGGLFTSSNPADRKVVPDDVGDRSVFKVVYVVLESQYQSSLTAACKRINAGQVCTAACGLHLHCIGICNGFIKWWPSVT